MMGGEARVYNVMRRVQPLSYMCAEEIRKRRDFQTDNSMFSLCFLSLLFDTPCLYVNSKWTKHIERYFWHKDGPSAVFFVSVRCTNGRNCSPPSPFLFPTLGLLFTTRRKILSFLPPRDSSHFGTQYVMVAHGSLLLHTSDCLVLQLLVLNLLLLALALS